MQIRSKLTISTFIAVLLLLILGGTSIIMIYRLAGISKQVADTQQTVVKLVEVKNLTRSVFNLLEMHVKLQDGADMGLVAEKIEELDNRLEQIFNKEGRLLEENPDNSSIQDLYRNWIELSQIGIEVIGLSDLFSSQAANEMLNMYGLPIYVQIDALLDKQLEHYRHTAQILKKRSTAAARASEILIGGVTVLIVFLVIFGGLIMTRSITSPLIKLSDYLRSNSLEGESDFKLKAAGQNELKTLIHSLEVQVRNRTEELRESNRLLEQEIEVRKKTEAEATDSERKYRRIFNNTTAWMAYTSLDGDFLETNISLMANLGYTEAELKKMNIQDVIPKADYPEMNAYQEKLRDEGHASGLMTLVGKTGEKYILDYQSNIITRSDGFENPVVVHFAKDITQQQAAETAFHESELRFQNLVNALPLAYFITDHNRSLVFANQKTADTFPGTAAVDPKSKLSEGAFMDFLIPEDRDRASQMLAQSLSGQQPDWHLYSCQREDGSIFPCEILTTALDQDEGSKHLQHILVDVSERLEKEELIKQKEVAEKTSSAISEWLSFVAHEIRNPLGGIVGFAKFGMTKAGSASSEKLLNYFDQIHQAGKRLEVLLNDLLDLSKMEVGHLSLERTRTDFFRIVSEVQHQNEAVLQEKELTLTVKYPETDTDSMIVICDPYRVGQVLRNLLSNAIKFTPSGKSITISFGKTMINGRRASDGKVEGIQVNVSDEGIGIPEDQLVLVFNKYKQSRKTRTGEGTGLGLPICKQIVTAHGGQIWVNSVENEGSTFSFTLPLSV